MGIVDSETFTIGNGVALRLPEEVAFAPNARVTIERRAMFSPCDSRRTQSRRMRGQLDSSSDCARSDPPMPSSAMNPSLVPSGRA